MRDKLLAYMVVAAFVLAVAFCGQSHAQNEKPVVTYPLGVSSSNVSGTITVTNTFQSVLPALTNQRGRTGCTIVNYGTNTMWVYEDGAAAGLPAATKAKSVQLAANQAYYCQVGGIVIKSALFITGTSGDAFYAAQQ